ncbi:MAG: HAD family hydrolase [Chloroflexota bacterium]
MAGTAGRATLAGTVFDMDGVLVESEHLWEENWHAVAAAHGYAWRPEDTLTCQGMSVPEWSGYLAARISRDDPVNVANEVIDRMIAALHAGHIEMLPGSDEMVQAAAARGPVAVASSAPRRLIGAVLEATGLMPHFSAWVSSEEVARGKPSPDVYEEAARRLGLDPRACAGVEDSSNGIRAAAAGLTVIGLPNPTYPPKPDAIALCSAIAASPAEARALLIERLGDPRG